MSRSSATSSAARAARFLARSQSAVPRRCSAGVSSPPPRNFWTRSRFSTGTNSLSPSAYSSSRYSRWMSPSSSRESIRRMPWNRATPWSTCTTSSPGWNSSASGASVRRPRAGRARGRRTRPKSSESEYTKSPNPALAKPPRRSRSAAHRPGAGSQSRSSSTSALAPSTSVTRSVCSLARTTAAPSARSRSAAGASGRPTMGSMSDHPRSSAPSSS